VCSSDLREEGEGHHAEEDHDGQGADHEFPVAADDGSPTGVEDAGDHRQHEHADEERGPEERADEDGEGLAVVVVGEAGEGEDPGGGEGDDAEGRGTSSSGR